MEEGKDLKNETENNKKTKLSSIKIIIGIIIIFVGLNGFVGAIKSYTKKEEVQTSSSTKKQKEITKVGSKTYNLGTTVRLGSWEITVLNAEDKKTLKDSFGVKTTENNYIVVKLKIKNMSNQARSLLTYSTETTNNVYYANTRSILELYDGKSTYIADYVLEDYVDNDFDMIFSKINPNTTITYNAVFETDLPSSQKEYKLKLNDNNEVFLKIK